KAGDTIEIGVERFSAVPRSSLLGRRNTDEVTATLALTVAAVLPAGDPAGDFNLTPNPSAPLNVYVALPSLQKQVGKPGRVHARPATGARTKELNADLARHLTLEDWGLRVTVPAARPEYVVVESEQLTLDPPTVAAVQAAAKDLGAESQPTFTYL